MKPSNRRTLLRNGLLALLTGGAAAAWRKRRRLVAQGKCINEGICCHCDALADCGLPRALSMKRSQARRSHG